VDFAVLPPEVNSGRMYAGAGAGPLIAAAAAWDGLASELGSAASSYESAISELGSSWLGPSSNAMAAAAAPYVAWMNATAAQAERTANQARLAVAAYQAAFAATVPPPVIAANRATLASLVATNILGQNTSAIAANQAEYAEMWAQDASAMYEYAGASAAATQLTPFSAAPQTTNPAGNSAQAVAASQATSSSTGTAVQAATSAQSAINPLQALADLINEFNATPLGEGLTSLFDTIGANQTFYSGYTFLACAPLFLLAPLMQLALPNLGAGGGLVSSVSAAPDALGSSLAGSLGSEVGAAGVGGVDVSAGLGRAASLGGLSVPQSWGTAAPEIRLAARALPIAGLNGVPAATSSPGGFFGGIPPVGSVVNAPRNGESGASSPPRRDGLAARYRPRTRVIAQMPGEAGAHDESFHGWLPPDRHVRVEEDLLSERERNELAELRRERDELAMERVAARLIKEAIRS